MQRAISTKRNLLIGACIQEPVDAKPEPSQANRGRDCRILLTHLADLPEYLRMERRQRQPEARCEQRLAVRQVLDIRTAIQKISLSKIPAQGTLIWGEVLTIDMWQSIAFITLRDKVEDDAVIEVSVGVKQNMPKLGDMICVRGRMELSAKANDGRLQLKVYGHVAENLGTSRRVKARHATIARLRQLGGQPKPVLGPLRHITLVTGVSTKGGEDFLQILGEEKNHHIVTEVVRTDITKPSQIVESLRQAANFGHLVAIVRGGGDAVALDVFNDCAVLETLWEIGQKVPIVLGIGHATDHCLAEQFAGLTCTTPTDAALKIRTIHAVSMPRAKKNTSMVVSKNTSLTRYEALAAKCHRMASELEHGRIELANAQHHYEEQLQQFSRQYGIVVRQKRNARRFAFAMSALAILIYCSQPVMRSKPSAGLQTRGDVSELDDVGDARHSLRRVKGKR